MPRDEHLEDGEDPRRDGLPQDDLNRLEDFLSEEALPQAGTDGLSTGNPEPTPELSPNNLTGDSYDARLFSELADASSELSALLDPGPPGAPEVPQTFGSLVEDFFRAFYKVSPTLADEEAVEERSRTINRPFVERLLEDEQTAITRISTCLDELSSGLSALEAGKKALEELKKRPDLREWMEQAASQTGPEHESEEDDATHPKAPEEGGDAESKPYPSPSPPPARSMRRLVREALSAGREEAESVRGALSGWGLEPGDLKVVPLSERLELARALRTPKMRSLADLVGRTKKLASARAREKVRQRQDEVHSVTLGGRLERVLPAELAAGLASGHPLRKLDFTRRLLEGNLLSYELQGADRVGRGPVIATIDASISMSGASLEWASAVALTLASVAAREGRFAHLIYFNTQIVREVRLQGTPRSATSKLDPRKLLEVATVAASGGTAYEPPVRRAIEVMGEADYGKADILVVTDGLCELSEEVVSELDAARERRSFKVVSVLIGGDAISGKAGSLEAFSDTVIPLAEIAKGPAGATQAGPIFESF